jgi:alpha-beta hydrolase superfamily lysophospholipase/fumarate reductase subunit D
MRKAILALGVLLISVPAWHWLRLWTPGGSERFYLLVPPVYLLLYAILAPDGWRRLTAYVRPAVAFVSFLALLTALYFFFMTPVAVPDGSGRVLHGVQPWQLVVTVYFVAAVLLVLSVPFGMLRWLCRRWDAWWVGAVESQKRSPRARFFLHQVVPAGLLLPLALPYLVGVMYVHRLKLPNLATPRELIGRDYEDATFTTADGLSLRGWFIPALQPSERTLLICHGVGINRAHILGYHALGDSMHANLFLFDFRGHGDSDGHTVSLGHREKLDVLAAVAYLRAHKPQQSRFLAGLGISMGSAALTRAAAEVQPPFDEVILDSPFAAAVELTDTIFAYVPAALRPFLVTPGVWLASLHAGCPLQEVRPIDQIAAVRAPLLIIHARGDRLIPVQHARRLFARAAFPKGLWIADTGDHCSAWNARGQYLQWVGRLGLSRLAAR